jgi:putative hemolysin
MRVIRTALLATVLTLSLTAPGQAQLIGMANPASTFCVATGGELVISDSASGQTGICVYGNGAAIEEWTLYRLFSGFSWLLDF